MHACGVTHELCSETVTNRRGRNSGMRSCVPMSPNETVNRAVNLQYSLPAPPHPVIKVRHTVQYRFTSSPAGANYIFVEFEWSITEWLTDWWLAPGPVINGPWWWSIADHHHGPRARACACTCSVTVSNSVTCHIYRVQCQKIGTRVSPIKGDTLFVYASESGSRNS